MAMTEGLLVHADETVVLATTHEVEVVLTALTTTLDRRAGTVAQVTRRVATVVLQQRVLLDRARLLVHGDRAAVVHAVQVHPLACRDAQQTTCHGVVAHQSTQIAASRVLQTVARQTEQTHHFVWLWRFISFTRLERGVWFERGVSVISFTLSERRTHILGGRRQREGGKRHVPTYQHPLGRCERRHGVEQRRHHALHRVQVPRRVTRVLGQQQERAVQVAHLLQHAVRQLRHAVQLQSILPLQLAHHQRSNRLAQQRVRLHTRRHERPTSLCYVLSHLVPAQTTTTTLAILVQRPLLALRRQRPQQNAVRLTLTHTQHPYANDRAHQLAPRTLQTRHTLRTTSRVLL